MPVIFPVTEWPDKFVGEKRLLGVDWTVPIGDDTIDSVTAEVLQGDCVITDPVVSFLDPDGVTQKVWVSGGSPGVHWVSCKANAANGRVLESRQWFWVRE